MLSGSARAGLVVILTFFATSLAAQKPDTATISGIVVDGITGRPLPGVLVAVDAFDWGVVSDQDGHFVLPRVPTGQTKLAVSQLGYATLMFTPAVEQGMAPLRITLQPQPLVLDGIKVMADRFYRRRMATAAPVQAFDRQDLRFSPNDILDFLRNHGVGVVPCLGGGGITNCARVRGRLIHPRVVIDEFPSIAGLDMLVGMPSSMIYMVEVYGHGGQIRVYTNDFMEDVGRHPLAPVPLWW